MSNLQTLTRERKRCPVKGVFWHKPTNQFLCYVGYHFRKTKPIDAWLPKVDRRVRSTHYLGSDQQIAVAEFLALKGKWKKVKVDHQARLAEMKAAGLPLPKDPRPVWPTARETVVAAPAVVQPPPVIESRFDAWSTGRPIKAVAKPTAELNDPMDLTVEEGLKKFLEQYKARVGLRGGKGIKANTYAKHSQNMICGLGLNDEYSRDRRPIDAKKRFRDLTLDDYRLFTEFWFDPKNSVSERTAKNYIGGLQQIIHTLRIKLPDGADEMFKVKSTTMPKIAKYDPGVLRTFLQCSDERARLFSMMFLNFGYYAVDIIGLLFEHITNAEGEPYVSGEMFITKRRERTTHQNNFATTAYVWPETQELMQKHQAKSNPFGTFFLSSHHAPYNVKTVSGLVDAVKKANDLTGKFSIKQFRKVGASQIKKLSGSDAMHQYKANALNDADKPYILEDYSLLTTALKKFRDTLKADGFCDPQSAMKTIKVSRRELYDQVWLTPMRTLAIRYGMSDVGLAKVCRRHEIPRPHVGYWAKMEVGKAPPQVALSPSRNPRLEEITLWDGPIEHPQPEPPVEYDPDIQALLDKAIAQSPVKVPTSMHNLHPLVRDAKEELEKSHVDFVGMVSSFRRDRGLVEVRVAKGSVRRAILFLDTLFKTIEKLGGKITLEFTDRWNPETTTLVNLSGTTVRGLRLREKYKQIKRIKDPKDPWSYPCTDKVPTGHFVLDQGTCYGQQYCEDGKKPGTEIDLRINAIVISLIHEAGQLRIAERKADAERQIAEEKERIRLQRAAERKQKRDEFRQLQKTEQAKLDRLMSETSRWHKSQRIRGYLAAIEQSVAAIEQSVAAIEQSVAAKGCPNPEELKTWLKWAYDQAARIDPLCVSPPSILDQKFDESQFKDEEDD